MGSDDWKTRCGATRKRGRPGRCSLPAGHGTDHPGVGQCKYHGGNTPIGVRAAARPSLQLLTGYATKLSPLDALLMCVRIAAAEVAFFTAQVQSLEETQIIVRPVEEVFETHTAVEVQMGVREAEEGDVELLPTKVTVKPQELNLWIRERRRATDDLARYSTMALKAGVDERLVSLAEGMGDKLAQTLEAILNDLQLTKKQQALAPTAVRKHLMVLEGGMAEVAG